MGLIRVINEPVKLLILAKKMEKAAVAFIVGCNNFPVERGPIFGGTGYFFLTSNHKH